jgi:hypothetical protein
MAKLFQTKNWETHQQAQGIYLPTYLVEPFCLDAYILGYVLVGRRVGTQNGGSEQGLGIPTLSFFLFLLLLLFVLRCERFGREMGAELAGETTIAGVLSSFDLRAHMKIGC